MWLRLSREKGDGEWFLFTDAFTDSAISNKFNGQVGEKELQPWDGEVTADSGSLEAIESPNSTNDNSVSDWLYCKLVIVY